MTDFETIIDFGTQNLKLSIFNVNNEIVYSSKQQIINNSEKSLDTLIRDAEKYLSTHIDNIIVLYDSSKFYSLDISIKKVFDQDMSIKSIYDNLIEEAHYLISQNNYRDQIVHLVVNNIIVDNNKKLENIIEEIKIKSLILEIKFICLSKILIKDINTKFKKYNLKISNLYCASYVKSNYHQKHLDTNDFLIYIDIGFQRTSSSIFHNGKFNYFKSLSIGGNNITKDIANILKLDLNYSEELKIKFNKLENNNDFNKNCTDKINPYSEIFEKNISIDLLKKIIEARIEEIIELVVLRSKFIKNLNYIRNAKLIIIGGGSELLSNNYNLSVKKLVSKLICFNENDTYGCEAGIDYHKSIESSYTKEKKRIKKYGFFEYFFNLFSK